MRLSYSTLALSVYMCLLLELRNLFQELQIKTYKNYQSKYTSELHKQHYWLWLKKKKTCISHVHLKFGETLCPMSWTKFTDIEGRGTLRSHVLRIFQEIQRSHFTSYHPLVRATPFCVILSTVCEVLYFLSEVFWSLVQERNHLPPTLRYQRRFWGFS